MLMKMTGCKSFHDVFADTNLSDDSDQGALSDVVPTDKCSLRRHNLESWLQVRYATVIHNL